MSEATPCHEDSFYEVWLVYDKSSAKTETVRVPRAALDDMIRCHRSVLGFSATPEQLLNGLLAREAVRANATTYEVRRDRLWAFLQDHYACDLPEEKRPIRRRVH